MFIIPAPAVPVNPPAIVATADLRNDPAFDAVAQAEYDRYIDSRAERYAERHREPAMDEFNRVEW